MNTAVRMVGKLISYWNIPLFSMSAMDHRLRDPSDYSTLVRLSTPSDRLATALLVFCHHNDVRVLRTLFCLNCTKTSQKLWKTCRTEHFSYKWFGSQPRRCAEDTLNHMTDSKGDWCSLFVHIQHNSSRSSSEVRWDIAQCRVSWYSLVRRPTHDHFYRAMLCIRGTSHGPVSVCLSVRP